jgi:hypothetical protein
MNNKVMLVASAIAFVGIIAGLLSMTTLQKEDVSAKPEQNSFSELELIKRNYEDREGNLLNVSADYGIVITDPTTYMLYAKGFEPNETFSLYPNWTSAIGQGKANNNGEIIYFFQQQNIEYGKIIIHGMNSSKFVHVETPSS